MGFRAIGRLRRIVRGRRPGDRFRARAAGEEAFSLIETVMALGLVFTVMLGLLASLSTGIRGLTTGRQGTGATSIAKQVVENARASDYEHVGHDLSNTADLDADPAISTDAQGNYVYEPDTTVGPEPLVGSANATYTAHEWVETRDAIDYTVRVYVTRVAPDSGDGYKRLTVHVAWSNPQYGSEGPRDMKVSTFLSEPGADPPSGVLTGEFPDGAGTVDVDSGSVTITGTVDGIDLSRAQILFPFVHSDIDAGLVINTRGVAASASSSLNLNSGTASGCSETGASVSCHSVKANTSADNDGGTVIPVQDIEGPMGDLGDTLTTGDPLSVSFGSTGSVVSKSSADSCAVSGCVAGPIGDGDGLAYGYDYADGPASISAAFEAGVVTGTLIESGTAGSATATIDQDAASASSLVSSVGHLAAPPMDLLVLDAGPLGFESAVKVSAVDVTATGKAGPSAASPSVTGDPITVSVYETTLLGSGYVDVAISPGDQMTETISSTFDVVDDVLDVTNTVTIETTVTSGAASTSTQEEGATITKAQADLTNWLIVEVHVVVQDLLGNPLADLLIELDYGRLAVSAEVSG